MTVFTPPNTVMGRALADRATALVKETSSSSTITKNADFDLVHSSQVQLPAPIRDAAKAALDRGETHYTTRPGIVELRTAIAKRTNIYGMPVTTNDVVITNGGVEALFIALQTLIAEPGPVHTAGIAPISVHDMIKFLGGELVEVQGNNNATSLPSPEDIASSNATTLLVQSPSPLTGSAYTREEIETILRSARESGTTVILDHSLSSDLSTSNHSASEEIGADLSLITIGSFSSEYDMGGWRIGWFTASAPHIQSMSGFKQTLSICTTAVSQYAALAALEECGEWLEERKKTLNNSKQSAIKIFEDAGISVLDKAATQYLLLDINSSAKNAIESKAGVLVEAGSDLHQSLTGFIRINIGAENLLAGAQHIADFVKESSS